MHILLDHISASLVAGILFIALFTMMHRNRQNAFEMSVNQEITEQSYQFLKIIERDIENMRSSNELASELAPIDSLCQLVDTSWQIVNPDGTIIEKTELCGSHSQPLRRPLLTQRFRLSRLQNMSV